MKIIIDCKKPDRMDAIHKLIHFGEEGYIDGLKLIGKAILDDGKEIEFQPKNAWVGDQVRIEIPILTED